jgi:hypothetical protein
VEPPDGQPQGSHAQGGQGAELIEIIPAQGWNEFNPQLITVAPAAANMPLFLDCILDAFWQDLESKGVAKRTGDAISPWRMNGVWMASRTVESVASDVPAYNLAAIAAAAQDLYAHPAKRVPASNDPPPSDAAVQHAVNFGQQTPTFDFSTENARMALEQGTEKKAYPAPYGGN